MSTECKEATNSNELGILVRSARVTGGSGGEGLMGRTTTDSCLPSRIILKKSQCK